MPRGRLPRRRSADFNCSHIVGGRGANWISTVPYASATLLHHALARQKPGERRATIAPRLPGIVRPILIVRALGGSCEASEDSK